MKARILLDADVSEAGEGWSDSHIASVLGHHRQHGCADPPATGGGRVRSGVDPQAFASLGQTVHLRRVAEAKLFVLACSEPPKVCPKRRLGGARWTLKLLETAVVELNIVERASDNTIGRTLKKARSSLTCKSNGSCRRMATQRS
jgi:hypothetical protein